MTPFDIVVVKTRWVAVVQVCGELDVSTAPRLYEQLVSLADEGVLDVTVDLTGLDFIDSSGLHALLAGLKWLRRQGGNLELRSPRPSTRKVFEITGLRSVFRLEPIEGAGPAEASSGAGGPAAQPQMTGGLSPGTVH